MHMIWRADVDRFDVRIADQLLERRIAMLDLELTSRISCSLWRAAENAAHRKSQPPQSFEMSFAHKAQPDNCNAICHLSNLHTLARWSDHCQRMLQIGDQILRAFDTHR